MLSRLVSLLTIRQVRIRSFKLGYVSTSLPFFDSLTLQYGLEFGTHVLVTTGMMSSSPVPPAFIYDLGLAQMAVHQPLEPKLFHLSAKASTDPRVSLLEILGQVYDSPVLKPPMPYDPNALLSARIKSALTDERLEEIQRICSQFCVDVSLGELEFDKKLEE